MDHRAYAIQDGPLKVEHIKLMHGANYFSNDPVVMIRLDLGEYDEVFTDQIPGFLERLRALLPSLVAHRCSLGTHGGFFQRVADGTLLGHVTEHVAIELENLAGIDAGYGKTRSTQTPRVYHVVFGLIDDAVGEFTAKGAVNAVNALLTDRDFDVAAFVEDLIALREDRLLGPSTQAIVDAAQRRSIPWLRLDRYNLVQLGTGRFQKHVRATITSQTSLIGVETADDKYLTYLRLAEAGIPVPDTIGTESPDEALAFLSEAAGPLVVKPAVGHSGLGVSLNISQTDALRKAVAWAQETDPKVVVQMFVPGDLYRLLIIDGQLVATVRRTPATIIGDGHHTVAELIDIVNREPERGIGDKMPLTQISLDSVATQSLANRGLAPETVLSLGQQLRVFTSAASKFGGTSTDVTDDVHPDNRFFAERAAQVLGLDVAGVDIISRDIGCPLGDHGGAVLGVSAAPDFRPHLSPTKGKRRDVATPVVTMLFPEKVKTRMPIFSVTGSFGKTTTALLLHHALTAKGIRLGSATSRGLVLDGHVIHRGDATAHQWVNLVLRDPQVEAAVFETPVEHILSYGLGYDRADYGIVLNVHDNLPDTDEIDDAEDLAYVKSVVAEELQDNGTAILNADDPLVLEMARRVRGRIAFFSQTYDRDVVREHIDQGGLAVVLDRQTPVIFDGRRREVLSRLEDYPVTHSGKTNINNESLLAAIAALYAFGFSIDILDDLLRQFKPTPDVLAGNANVWKTQKGTILLDGAQHIASLKALAPFLASLAKNRTCVMGISRDVKMDHVPQIAEQLMTICDRLILVNEHSHRQNGLRLCRAVKLALTNLGCAQTRISLAQESEDAWDRAIENAGEDGVAVFLTSRVDRAGAWIESQVG